MEYIKSEKNSGTQKLVGKIANFLMERIMFSCSRLKIKMNTISADFPIETFFCQKLSFKDSGLW